MRKPDVWHRLRRPFRLPHVAPGAPCPIAEGRVRDGGHSAAFGSGPVYIVGFGMGTQAIARLSGTPPAGQALWSYKAFWIARPRFHGPVLVRGRSIDGTTKLLFSRYGGPLVTEERLSFKGLAGPSWEEAAGPRYLQLPAGPGCYVLQADGLRFSTSVVFSAAVNSP